VVTHNPFISKSKQTTTQARLLPRILPVLFIAAARRANRPHQTPTERATETQMAQKAQDREQYRGAVEGLAQDYARITGDPEAEALIRAYVERRVSPLDLEKIEGMREGLRVAADPAGNYRALPEPVQKACLELCFGLEEVDDRRLIGILDAADARSKVTATTIGDRAPGLVFEDGQEREQDGSLKDSQGYSRWGDDELGAKESPALSRGGGQKP